MKTFGNLLAAIGIVLLLAAWQMEALFSLFGFTERLIEEGGTLHYRYHLERNRMIGIWVGSSCFILGSILYFGARIIARNEAAREQQQG